MRAIQVLPGLAFLLEFSGLTVPRQSLLGASAVAAAYGLRTRSGRP